jgi:hypothetical protein
MTSRDSKRKTAPAAGSVRLKEDVRPLVSVATVLGPVALVLALGALMRADEPARPAAAPEPRPVARLEPAPEPAPPAIVPPAEPAPEPALTPAPRPPSSLAERAALDVERLEREAGSFTAKLATVCDADNARRFLDRFGRYPELHLLPASVGGRSCCRLCWGVDRDRAAAGSPRLPADLRAHLDEPPQGVPVEAVLP